MMRMQWDREGATQRRLGTCDRATLSAKSRSCTFCIIIIALYGCRVRQSAGVAPVDVSLMVAALLRFLHPWRGARSNLQTAVIHHPYGTHQSAARLLWHACDALLQARR